MVYSFRNFISNINEYQNYFGYKIFFQNITDKNNLTTNSTTNQTQNTTNQSDVIKNQTKNHTGTINKKNRIAKADAGHNTGNPILMLALSLAVLVFKRRR